MTSTEPGRLAAHVLLDAVSAYSEDDPEELSGKLLNLAVARLGEVDCVQATYDDETDIASVDASGLVGGTLVLVNGLVERIVLATGLPREVVISQTREVLDRSL